MTIEFLPDEGEVRALAVERFSRRSHWFLLAPDARSDALLERVEDRHYPPGTPANADFELLIQAAVDPLCMVQVAMADRRRMSADQLQDVLGGQLDQVAIDSGIVCLFDSRRLGKETAMRLFGQVLTALGIGWPGPSRMGAN